MIRCFSFCSIMKDWYKFEKKGATLVYSDTDSLFYLAPKNSFQNAQSLPVCLGNSYGQYKKEYDHPIVTFICLGNKNYCLVFQTPDAQVQNFIIKVRGFQLKSLLTTNINPALFKKFVLAYFNEGKEMRTHTLQFGINIEKKKNV